MCKGIKAAFKKKKKAQHSEHSVSLALCELLRSTFARRSLNKPRLAAFGATFPTCSASNTHTAQATSVQSQLALPMGMPSVGQVLLRELPREQHPNTHDPSHAAKIAFALA